MIGGFRVTGVLLMVLAVLVPSALAWHYHGAYVSKRDTVYRLDQQIKQQNDDAAAKLASLTRERDRQQAELDQLATAQEKRDADAQAEIDRLTAELSARPIRVRYRPADAGGRRCRGPEGDSPGAAGVGQDGEAAATGVLPDANSRRLAGALSQVEQLSAAYNSCRAMLMAGEIEG